MDKYLVLENGNVYKGKAFGAEGANWYSLPEW